MTLLYSPYYISNIILKPEWYLENNNTSECHFWINLMMFENLTSKSEWYLENMHPFEWQFSIHLTIFEK